RTRTTVAVGETIVVPQATREPQHQVRLRAATEISDVNSRCSRCGASRCVSAPIAARRLRWRARPRRPEGRGALVMRQGMAKWLSPSAFAVGALAVLGCTTTDARETQET